MLKIPPFYVECPWEQHEVTLGTPFALQGVDDLYFQEENAGCKDCNLAGPVPFPNYLLNVMRITPSSGYVTLIGVTEPSQTKNMKSKRLARTLLLRSMRAEYVKQEDMNSQRHSLVRALAPHRCSVRQPTRPGENAGRRVRWSAFGAQGS